MFDTYTAQEVACGNVYGGGTGDDAASGLVPYSADKAVALHHNIDIGRNQQLHATQIGMDVNLLVLADGCLAQVEAQPAAEGIQAGAMEWFAPIYVLIGTETDSATHAFAIFTLRHRALKPLGLIVAVTVNNEFGTNIQ